MRLTRRRAETAASYAAVVADRWLWLAAPEPLEATLEGAEVPTLVDDGQPGRHGVRFDLTALPPTEGRYRVLAGRRPLVAPPMAPSGTGTTHALERDDDGHLLVVRRVVAAGPTLRGARLVGETVELRLEGADGPLELVDETRVVARVDPGGGPDDEHWTLTPAHLDDATAGQVLRVRAGGRLVRRRDNTLADPGTGALLPAVHPAGAADPVARLRWAPDATLVVRVVAR